MNESYSWLSFLAKKVLRWRKTGRISVAQGAATSVIRVNQATNLALFLGLAAVLRQAGLDHGAWAFAQNGLAKTTFITSGTGLCTAVSFTAAIFLLMAIERGHLIS
jgi:hypothetical protein